MLLNPVDKALTLCLYLSRVRCIRGYEAMAYQADDIDALLGLTDILRDKPAEERFIEEYSAGSVPRFVEYFAWLKSEMDKYMFLCEEHAAPHKSKVLNGVTGKYPVSSLEFAKLMTKYYCWMRFHPRFNKNSGLPAEKLCDMDKTVALMMELPVVKKIISEHIFIA